MLCWKRKTENIGFRLRALFWASLSSITLVLCMGAPHAVHAVPLSNTAISGAQFITFLGSPITALNTSSIFGGDVDILSQVFLGKALTPAEGFNVYTYQIKYIQDIQVLGVLTQFNLDWVVGAPELVDFTGTIGSMIDSFYVTAPPNYGEPTGFMEGTEDPGTSLFNPVSDSVRFEFPVNGNFAIEVGETSFILGLFSYADPALGSANVVDDFQSFGEVYAPYAPVPEPSTLLLLGIGLAGIVIYTGYRERRRAKATA